MARRFSLCLMQVATLLLSVLAASPLARAESTAPQARGPKVSVDKPVHDFGVLAPQEVSEHEFVVSNVGDELLKIDMVTASCRCVLPEKVKGGLKPGESTGVKVSFKGKPSEDRYVQTVTLSTNDPARPQFELKIVGKIAPVVWVAPGRLRISGIEPGASASERVDVLSSEWAGFRIENLKPSSDSLRLSTSPLPESALRLRGAKSGYAVRVEIDESLTQKDFQEHFYLTVTPNSDELGQPKTLRVVVIGKVRGRLAVFGQGVDQYGRLNLGPVDRIEGKTRRFMLKVHDEQTDLLLKNTVVDPSYVQVRLAPYTRTQSKRLYQLEVTVPPGQLDRAYIGPHAGKIRLEFDHPRIEDLELKLELMPSARR